MFKNTFNFPFLELRRHTSLKQLLCYKIDREPGFDVERNSVLSTNSGFIINIFTTKKIRYLNLSILLWQRPN